MTVVDTAAADLRRIERDLHDGAQARLVALAMDLGLAKEKLLEDPDAARRRMVDEAHGEVKLALQELRDLARGIHPAILTDRGLGPALSSLAARCTVPVTVTVDLAAAARRPPSRASPTSPSPSCCRTSASTARRGQASVEVWRAEDRLLIQVTDDGRGGARLDGGSGLAGLAERLGAVDGLFVLDSPAGGPTPVTAELPWRARTEPADRRGADEAGPRAADGVVRPGGRDRPRARGRASGPPAARARRRRVVPAAGRGWGKPQAKTAKTPHGPAGAGRGRLESRRTKPHGLAAPARSDTDRRTMATSTDRATAERTTTATDTDDGPAHAASRRLPCARGAARPVRGPHLAGVPATCCSACRSPS